MNSPKLMVGDHAESKKVASLQSTIKIWYDDDEECAKMKCIFDLGIMGNECWEYLYLDGASYGTLMDLENTRGEM